MPINLNLNPEFNVGKATLRWSFQEFKVTPRGKAWWIIAGLIVLLMVVYALQSGNFLFALIIIMGSILFINETRREPRKLECKITSSGVVVGKKFWRWSDLRNFWIAYRPPEVTSLYLVPKNPLDPRIPIPLEKINPLTIRELLSKYVDEDLEREDEPTSEALAKILKLK